MKYRVCGAERGRTFAEAMNLRIFAVKELILQRPVIWKQLLKQRIKSESRQEPTFLNIAVKFSSSTPNKFIYRGTQNLLFGRA